MLQLVHLVGLLISIINMFNNIISTIAAVSVFSLYGIIDNRRADITNVIQSTSEVLTTNQSTLAEYRNKVIGLTLQVSAISDSYSAVNDSYTLLGNKYKRLKAEQYRTKSQLNTYTQLTKDLQLDISVIESYNNYLVERVEFLESQVRDLVNNK